jgi:hypothetical protein
MTIHMTTLIFRNIGCNLLALPIRSEDLPHCGPMETVKFFSNLGKAIVNKGDEMTSDFDSEEYDTDDNIKGTGRTFQNFYKNLRFFPRFSNSSRPSISCLSISNVELELDRNYRARLIG